MDERVTNAQIAAGLFATSPHAFGGVWIRSRFGETQKALLELFSRGHGAIRRISPGIDDLALWGGLDPMATLSFGRTVHRAGCLGPETVAIIAGGERLSASLGARLASALDEKRLGGVILLDEGGPDDPLPPASLLDRLAFFVSDDESGFSGVGAPYSLALAEDKCSERIYEDIAQVTLALSLDGMRPILFAAEAARRLGGDVEMALRLTVSHRVSPVDAADDIQPKGELRDGRTRHPQSPEDQDVIIETIRTALPASLISEIHRRSSRTAKDGAGGLGISHQRGRPLPSVSGRTDGRAQVDLIATLKAAAPWQRVRGRTPGSKPCVHSDDTRLKRYRRRNERLLIFAVDASGSAAMARLGEAKGAVEHLLSEAYRSRDSVALIAFRGELAETLLPPSRSLVRAKRSLSALPGGGGTPLASGMAAAKEMAVLAQRRGLSVELILMTDGRGNRTLNGVTDREQAMEEAVAMARDLCHHRVPTLLVDSGRRRTHELSKLAAALGAQTVSLAAAVTGNF